MDDRKAPCMTWQCCCWPVQLEHRLYMVLACAKSVSAMPSLVPCQGSDDCSHTSNSKSHVCSQFATACCPPEGHRGAQRPRRPASPAAAAARWAACRAACRCSPSTAPPTRRSGSSAILSARAAACSRRHVSNTSHSASEQQAKFQTAQQQPHRIRYPLHSCRLWLIMTKS